MFKYVNYSAKFINNINLDDIDAIRQQCFFHCISKFESKYKITLINESSKKDSIITMLVLKNCNVRFPTSDLPDKIYNAKVGDIFSFHSSINFNVNNQDDVLLFSYKYLNEKRKHGNGKKVFEINTKLEDLYTLDVYADTLEEAVEFAKNTDILYWHHVDMYPEISDSKKITRYSKWHLFFGKEKQ